MSEPTRALRVLAVLILPLLAPAQERVVLEHADSLVGLVIDGEQARALIGNVHFTQGTVDVRCQRAVQYTRTNRITFDGEAEMWDGKMRLVAARGTYDGAAKVAEAFDRVLVEEGLSTVRSTYAKYFANEKRALFKNNVVAEDSGSVLTANELTTFRDEGHSIAVGNVVITNRHNNVVVTGDRFEAFKKRKFNQMVGHPRLVQADTARGGARDTLVVTSKTLETYQDTVEQLTARDSVVITRGALAAEAGLCVFFTEKDSMILRQNPFVWYRQGEGEENQLSGDSIYIKLKNRKPESVVVTGSAMAISNADSLYPARLNQMSGEEIVFRFDSSRIRQIDVDKTATSLYYLFEDKKGNGLNKTTGDHVTLTMVEGKVDRLKVVGGIEGEYVPERLVKNRESDFNLRGFNWRQRRQPNSRK